MIGKFEIYEVANFLKIKMSLIFFALPDAEKELKIPTKAPNVNKWDGKDEEEDVKVRIPDKIQKEKN